MRKLCKHLREKGISRKEKVYLYVGGEGRKEDIKAKLPTFDVSVFHEIILKQH